MCRQLLLFALALLTRLIFIGWRGPILSTDSVEYLRIADNIRHHLSFSTDSSPPFEPTIFRAPLYPGLIALLPQTEDHGPVFILFLQSILDGLVTVCVFSLALRVATQRWAFAMALAYAFNPGAIATCATVLSESVFAALGVFALVFITRSLSRDSLPHAAAGGAALGLAALNRSIGAVFPVLLFLAISISRWSRRRLAHAVVMLSAATFVLVPWVIRSSLLARSFVLVQAPSFALNFYYPTRLDWNQRDQASIWASFFSDDPCGKCFVAAKTPVEMAAVSRFCLREAMQNIRRAPIRYFLSRLRAFPHLLLTSFDNFTGFNESFSSAYKDQRLGRIAVKLTLLVLFSAVPLCLAALSIRDATQNEVIGLCAVVCGFTLLVHIPMWIEYRYWQPVVPLLMVMSARGAESAFRRGGMVMAALTASRSGSTTVKERSGEQEARQ